MSETATDTPFTVTDRAFRRVAEILADKDAAALRVAVEGGGCSGFQYTYDLVDAAAEDDLVHAFRRMVVECRRLHSALPARNRVELCYREARACKARARLVSVRWRVMQDFLEALPSAPMVCGAGEPRSAPVHRERRSSSAPLTRCVKVTRAADQMTESVQATTSVDSSWTAAFRAVAASSTPSLGIGTAVEKTRSATTRPLESSRIFAATDTRA